MIKRFSYTSFILAALFSFCANIVSAAPLEIRIQWSVTPAHLTPLIPLAPKDL